MEAKTNRFHLSIVVGVCTFLVAVSFVHISIAWIHNQRAVIDLIDFLGIGLVLGWAFVVWKGGIVSKVGTISALVTWYVCGWIVSYEYAVSLPALHEIPVFHLFDVTLLASTPYILLLLVMCGLRMQWRNR